MGIKIGGYDFDGPFSSTSSLEDMSGVYAILYKKDNGNYSLVDVGESATVKSRVENHDRQSCWERNCHSTLMVAVFYTPRLQQSGRRRLNKRYAINLNYLAVIAKCQGVAKATPF